MFRFLPFCALRQPRSGYAPQAERGTQAEKASQAGSIRVESVLHFEKFTQRAPTPQNSVDISRVWWVSDIPEIVSLLEPLVHTNADFVHDSARGWREHMAWD
jgi:hypothetical protein